MKYPILTLLCVCASYAQEAASPPPEVKPDHVVAEVSGHPVTAGELKRILANAPENIYQVINDSPGDFLERYTMLSQLTGDAIKAGLDQKSPYKDRLDWQRTTVLMMALLEEKTQKGPVSEQDIEAAYKADLMRFRVAEVLPIVLPYDNSGGVLRDENTARKRAQEVWQSLRNGAPFRETMLKASDPRAAEKYKQEHPTILPNSKLPPNVIKTVFSTLPGQYTEPLQFGNAFYILQTLTLGAAPLSEVRELIASEIRQKRVDGQMKHLRESAKVEVKHPVYFQLQDPTAPPNREIPADLKPETVVALVNGRAYTSAEMTHVLNGAPPTVRQAASRQPQEFLLQLGMMNQLAAEARQTKLNERAPASDRIRWTDMQTLMQAQIDETMKGISNSAEEQEKYYRDNAQRYRRARVKMIYISYSLAPSPPGAAQRPRNDREAKARAEEALAKAKAGTDFTLLVREYSDDAGSKANNGDFMPILATDTRIPEDVKMAILSTPVGQVTAPVQQPNGFYLFLVEESGVISYEQIRNQVYEEMRQAKFQKWFEDLRSGIKVKVVDADAIRALSLRSMPM